MKLAVGMDNPNLIFGKDGQIPNFIVIVRNLSGFNLLLFKLCFFILKKEDLIPSSWKLSRFDNADCGGVINEFWRVPRMDCFTHKSQTMLISVLAKECENLTFKTL